MTTKRILTALLGITLASAMNLSAQVAAVNFKVHVPHLDGNNKTVYMTGSFNYWHAGDTLFQMSQVSEGIYAITLPLFEGRQYEYKYTLGSWDKVEVALNDSDVHNRYFFSANGKNILDTVIKWKQPKVADKNAGPSPQMVKIMAMKDSALAKLQPGLKDMQVLLQSYVRNLLQAEPSERVHKRLDKQATRKIENAYKTVTNLLWNIFATLTPEQKQKISDAINQPGAKDNFLNSFISAMGNVMAEKKPAS